MKGYYRSGTISTLLALAMLLAVVPATAMAQEISGTWETRRWDGERGDGKIQMNLRVDRGRGDSNNGFSIALSRLEGLSATVANGTASDVSFRMVREAGTVTFDGDFRNGRGTGFFTFVPDAAYASAMDNLGYGGLSAERVYQFALHDVTTEYVRGLQDLGYEGLSEEDLNRFAIHGVRLDYIRGMNDLGYRAISAKDLVRMRIHGVTIDFVREVREALG